MAKSAYLGWKPHSFGFAKHFIYIYIYSYMHTLSASRRIFIFLRAIKRKEHRVRCVRYRSNVRKSRTLFSVFSLRSFFAPFFVSSHGICCCFCFSFFVLSLTRSDKQLREALRDEKTMLQLCLLCKLFFVRVSLKKGKRRKRDHRMKYQRKKKKSV